MKCARHCSFLGRRQVADDDRPSIGEEFRYDIARRLPFLFTEKKLDFGDCNKIFSTSWISEDLVVAGTKCNKVSALLRFWGVWIWNNPRLRPSYSLHSLQLFLVDINNERIMEIPCLGESPLTPASRSTCGIHSVCCSPSHEWLATGGANPNQLAFYHLPEFQPFALGSVSTT